MTPVEVYGGTPVGTNILSTRWIADFKRSQLYLKSEGQGTTCNRMQLCLFKPTCTMLLYTQHTPVGTISLSPFTHTF